MSTSEGKIFEYFAARKPILAFGPIDSDTQRLINEINAGFYFTYQEDNIKDKLLQIFRNKKMCNIKDIEKFSRESLTVQLADILNTI